MAAPSLRRACALPGSIENLPLDRPDHPLHCFSSTHDKEDPEFQTPTQTPSILAGIVPLERVTRYRDLDTSKNIPPGSFSVPSTTTAQSPPSTPAAVPTPAVVPTSTQNNQAVSPQSAPTKTAQLLPPPPIAPRALTAGINHDSDSDDLEVEPPADPNATLNPLIRRKQDNHPCDDLEDEVKRLARPLLLPSLSKYERERIINRVRNDLLLKQLCLPTFDIPSASNSSKRQRSPSPSAEYRPTASSGHLTLPLRKSRRLMEGSATSNQEEVTAHREGSNGDVSLGDRGRSVGVREPGTEPYQDVDMHGTFSRDTV